MFPTITQQALETQSTTPLVPLGTVFYDPRYQGKKAFRYIEITGQSAMTAGLLLVAPAAPSNSTGLALPTSNTTTQLSSGSRQLLITNGGTAITTNQFQDGELEILGTNGAGQKYTIAGNSADSTGTGVITVNLVDPLRNTTALANGTNTVNLRQSIGYNPAASLTKALPVGVTIAPWPSTSGTALYGWVQIAGPAFVFATSATKGQPLVQDTAGTAGYLANNAASTTIVVGSAHESVASSLASIFLQLN